MRRNTRLALGAAATLVALAGVGGVAVANAGEAGGGWRVDGVFPHKSTNSGPGPENKECTAPWVFLQSEDAGPVEGGGGLTCDGFAPFEVPRALVVELLHDGEVADRKQGFDDDVMWLDVEAPCADGQWSLRITYVVNYPDQYGLTDLNDVRETKRRSVSC